MLFSRTRSMSPAEVAEGLRERRLTVVDVREPAELQRGRIEGARAIPLGELPQRMHELQGGTTVAFICQSGARSARATRAAGKAGVDAVNVSGGMAGWARAGLPLTPGGTRR
jgi:rhodanese-related sulfurtransferase